MKINTVSERSCWWIQAQVKVSVIKWWINICLFTVALMLSLIVAAQSQVSLAMVTMLYIGFLLLMFMYFKFFNFLPIIQLEQQSRNIWQITVLKNQKKQHLYAQLQSIHMGFYCIHLQLLLPHTNKKAHQSTLKLSIYQDQIQRDEWRKLNVLCKLFSKEKQKIHF